MLFVKALFFFERYLILPAERRIFLKKRSINQKKNNETKVAKLLTYRGQVIYPIYINKYVYIYIYIYTHSLPSKHDIEGINFLCSILPFPM